MAYEQNKDTAISQISSAELPDSAKNGITEVLSQLDSVKTEKVESSGEISGDADLVQVTTGGDFTASSESSVIMFDTNEDVRVTITPPVPGNVFKQVVVLGGGSDSVSFNASGERIVNGEVVQASEADAGGATIEAGAGDDTVSGSTGNDTISGGTGDDTISGGEGNDVITAGSGNDTVDGGSGFDTVNLQAGRSSYTITSENGQLVLTNGSEVKTLSGVEFVSFDDGSIITSHSSADEASVARLYEVLLDRAADADGLQYWLDKLEQGASLQEIADGFTEAAEYAAEQPDFALSNDQSNGDFIEGLYQQSFGRDSDAEGKAFWLNKLETEGVSRSDVAAGFAESTEAAEDFDYIQIVGVN